MHRLGGPQEHRPDRDAPARSGLQQVVADVGGIDIGQDQQVGFPCEGAAGHELGPVGGVQCGVAVHLAVHGQPRCLLTHQGQRFPHLHGRRQVAGTEVAV